MILLRNVKILGLGKLYKVDIVPQACQQFILDRGGMNQGEIQGDDNRTITDFSFGLLGMNQLYQSLPLWYCSHWTWLTTLCPCSQCPPGTLKCSYYLSQFCLKVRAGGGLVTYRILVSGLIRTNLVLDFIGTWLVFLGLGLVKFQWKETNYKVIVFQSFLNLVLMKLWIVQCTW